jgi:RNA recognition motif-containing protein
MAAGIQTSHAPDARGSKLPLPMLGWFANGTRAASQVPLHITSEQLAPVFGEFGQVWPVRPSKHRTVFCTPTPSDVPGAQVESVHVITDRHTQQSKGEAASPGMQAVLQRREPPAAALRSPDTCLPRASHGGLPRLIRTRLSAPLARPRASAGCAFVTYANADDAQAAIEALNNKRQLSPVRRCHRRLF